KGDVESTLCPRDRDGGEVMINEAILEQRLANLERAVADLERRVPATPASGTWLEKVTGSISDEAAFLEALNSGQPSGTPTRPPSCHSMQLRRRFAMVYEGRVSAWRRWTCGSPQLPSRGAWCC